MHNGLDFGQETGTGSPYASTVVAENDTGMAAPLRYLLKTCTALTSSTLI